jgi:D-alanyl-lipoteichoic acid acyltransferase DltB (MBOAT superfamily)
MLFNSASFIFGFLPVALVGNFLLGRLRPHWAIVWIVLASLFFYAQLNLSFVPILLASVLGNYQIGRQLERSPSRWLLLLGVGANLSLIIWFKYAHFVLNTLNGVLGAGWTLPTIVLPLAISFYTFQQIAYLVDIHAGQPSEPDLTRYAFSVLFFPQLIAGPIVYNRDILKQLDDERRFRLDKRHLAIGLALFTLGLFKKVCLADPLSPVVAEVFADAATGTVPVFGRAWIATLAYALQLYFDFSGYSDMAIGLALMVNIRLPVNFWSPYKAASIIEFWSRWHMTLTRFLTDYVYNPIALNLTRRRSEKGLPLLRRSYFAIGPFLVLVAVPTLTTFLISGLWHGAGWNFVLWGVLHGLMLVVNHAWRALQQTYWIGSEIGRWFRPLGVVLTFLCVAVTLIVFRASDLPQAWTMMRALVQFPTLAGAHEALVSYLPQVVAGLAIVWFFPNTLEWLGGFRSAKDVTPSVIGRMASAVFTAGRHVPGLGTALRPLGPDAGVLKWTPSLASGVLMGTLACFDVIRMLGVTPAQFLYFTF